MTPSDITSTTFWFVQHYLNQLPHHVTYTYQIIRKCMAVKNVMQLASVCNASLIKKNSFPQVRKKTVAFKTQCLYSVACMFLLQFKVLIISDVLQVAPLSKISTVGSFFNSTAHVKQVAKKAISFLAMPSQYHSLVSVTIIIDTLYFQ